ncbi:major facilitator superfamily MFS_1 [Cellulomonas flavigena DSM 20109]|uniref:Major facilitator superfamily MFS_1 n=1 Tax=Cellulomonas flavigena (strain ATCC 482 / DSM 20109 / BCRC 11376 / JCM 18109 / NBRC 3775 / NCIMB 8073 / NRS 134) TaxID=446466 RepID=D5UK35_CELFN|nr:MFS transporter [Cellulomonas flavigena]ADG73777.1 major facilitator superfamily MFS_1 [Cellulomonas flavigena DSM 20109]
MTARHARGGVLLAALLLVALNLRGPITALAPVVEDVGADLALTPAAVGLLTGVPVLCFAALTPVAAVALARAGTTRMLAATLVAILAGTLLRSFGGVPGAFAGMLVIGAAVTVGNVGVPTVVARDFPTQVPRAMGLFSAVMNAGAALTTLGTAPLASLMGWRWALASWGALAVVALAVWARVHAGVDGPPAAPTSVPGTVATGPAVHVLRRPVTWLLCAAFVGQASSYYGATTWLPSVLHDDAGLGRAAAGAAASLFQVLGVLGSVLAPFVLARRVPPRVVVVGVAACWLSLPVGLLLAPGGWAVWATLAGLAQGANFVLLFTVAAAAAGSPADVRRMSATVQTVGYSVAAVTPSVLGALHTASGGWTGPLLAVLGLLVLQVGTHTVAAGALPRRTA